MNERSIKESCCELAEKLESMKIPYYFDKESSAILQGVTFPKYINIITIYVQWDLIQDVYDQFQSFSPSPIIKDMRVSYFQFYMGDLFVEIKAMHNTTIRTNPYLITVELNNRSISCLSIYAMIFDVLVDNDMKTAIHQYLNKKQENMNEQNQLAWNQNQFEALVKRYGRPEERVEKIKNNPSWTLHPFYKYFGDVQGKNIVHLLGSNGIKATALSILGADVTVIDFSKENEQYARLLAEESGQSVKYINQDLLQVNDDLNGTFDIAFMELGVLHYFLDLHMLFKKVSSLLKQGGLFILHEFHPVSTKLITSKGKKHKVTGNYFNPSIIESDVAFAKLIDEKDQLQKVYHRKWTLGEIITAMASEQLQVQILEEEPNHKLDDIGIPKTFTAVAKKIKLD